MLELRRINKTFGALHAVRDVELTIQSGEFFSLLGPSGCGKTTLLRMLGGFDSPTSGEILLDGKRIDPLPPDQRHFNMVFQRYALFPHLNVFDNIAFGPRMKKAPEADIRQRVAEVLQLVRLDGLENRSVTTLSGGQQQRVALARALVNRPKVLLLDEPLSALDLKLRQQMQVELHAIQRKLGLTFILVTHDQEEALTLSDRIAVMNQGRIEQVGRGREIYEWPATEFVAQFIGSINTFEGQVEAKSSETLRLRMGKAVIEVSLARDTGKRAVEIRDRAKILVRPEKLTLRPAGSAKDDSENFLSGRIQSILYQGPVTQFLIGTEEFSRPLIAVQANTQHTSRHPFAVGDPVDVSWYAEDGLVIPANGGTAS